MKTYSPKNPQKRIEEYPAILLGRHPTKNTYLASYGQQFAMLAAPPGTGKGVGLVIPNLLSYPDSVVVNDPKFENWHITAGFRAAAGHQVYRFSPELMETHRWNPLSQLSRDPLYRLGSVRTMASVLFVSSNEKNQEWYTKAANVFAAILLYMMETPALPFTLPQVYEVAALGPALGAWAEQVIANRSEGPDALTAETLRELNGVVGASKNKSSGWSTTADILRDVLSIYAEKTLAWALSGDDIDFSKAREVKMSVYFSCSEESLTKFGPLMNLFFTQAIRQNSKVLPEQGGNCPDGTLRYKYQLLLLMDELAVMGRMAIMETGPALTRGAGLRYLIIFQGKDQVLGIYGAEKGNAIMKAFHSEIVYAPGDIDIAEKYSKRLGTYTVRVQNQSFSGREVTGRNKTDSYTEQARPLMLPQEVNELAYDKQIIFLQGTKTTEPLKVLCRKVFYYEDPVFNERSNLPPPALPIGDASKIDALVVPIRLEEPAKVALTSPHDDALKAQHEKRSLWKRPVTPQRPQSQPDSTNP